MVGGVKEAYEVKFCLIEQWWPLNSMDHLTKHISKLPALHLLWLFNKCHNVYFYIFFSMSIHTKSVNMPISFS